MSEAKTNRFIKWLESKGYEPDYDYEEDETTIWIPAKWNELKKIGIIEMNVLKEAVKRGYTLESLESNDEAGFTLTVWIRD